MPDLKKTEHQSKLKQEKKFEKPDCQICIEIFKETSKTFLYWNFWQNVSEIINTQNNPVTLQDNPRKQEILFW